MAAPKKTPPSAVSRDTSQSAMGQAQVAAGMNPNIAPAAAPTPSARQPSTVNAAGQTVITVTPQLEQQLRNEVAAFPQQFVQTPSQIAGSSPAQAAAAEQQGMAELQRQMLRAQQGTMLNQPMPQAQQQTGGSFFPQGGGMVTAAPQPLGMTAGMGQDLLNLIKNPQQIGQQMQTGQVSPGLAAVGLAADLAMPGVGGGEANLLRKGSRALGTNPRNLAKLSPEIIAQIKVLTGATAKLEDAGKILMQPGGEKVLASMGKSTLGTATETAMNSKVKEVVGAAVKKWGDKLLIGSLGISTAYKYSNNQKSAQNELTSYLDESAKTQTALRNTGNPKDAAAADTLAQAGDQLEQDLAKWTSALPLLGSGNKKIQEAERTVNAHNNRMAANKITAEKAAVQNQLAKEAEKSQADRKVLSSMVGKSDEQITSSSEIAEAANENPLIQKLYLNAQQRIIDQRNKEEQRIFDQIQKEIDRAFAESQRAEQRAFTISQAPSQEDSGGSALNFGGGQF